MFLHAGQLQVLVLYSTVTDFVLLPSTISLTITANLTAALASDEGKLKLQYLLHVLKSPQPRFFLIFLNYRKI